MRDKVFEYFRGQFVAGGNPVRKSFADATMKATNDQTHILVVDDEPELREILRCGLEAEGFVVVEAANKARCFAAWTPIPSSSSRWI